MSASVNTDKVFFNFYWQGPSICRGGASQGGQSFGIVHLNFNDTKTDIEVSVSV